MDIWVNDCTKKYDLYGVVNRVVSDSKLTSRKENQIITNADIFITK